MPGRHFSLVLYTLEYYFIFALVSVNGKVVYVSKFHTLKAAVDS